jgi:1,4-dihydroxy-6-naphthoate synthase
MRRFAQEFDDSVLMKHVDLYVNDWTRELGDVGERALDELSNRAFEIGLTGDHAKLRLTTSAR